MCWGAAGGPPLLQWSQPRSSPPGRTSSRPSSQTARKSRHASRKSSHLRRDVPCFPVPFAFCVTWLSKLSKFQYESSQGHWLGSCVNRRSIPPLEANPIPFSSHLIIHFSLQSCWKKHNSTKTGQNIRKGLAITPLKLMFLQMLQPSVMVSALMGNFQGCF